MRRKLIFVFLTLAALVVGGLPLISPSAQARLSGPGAAVGVQVPNGTRKVPRPPSNVQPVAPNPSFRPLACLAPVVNISQTSGNESESFVVVNPTNPNDIVAFSNLATANSIFRAYSLDGGTNWTHGTVATGVACCDGQAVFDRFGNLFLIYINAGATQINVILSTDGGVTFGAPVTVGTGSIDQPSIAAGNGSLWIDWNSSNNMVARGAPVTGLGAWGPFGAQQSIPSATGSFGGITVGPGPNGGKVMVTYMNPTGGQGPATIYVNVDADGLGAGGFGARITATTTNVGGFDFIPAQSGRSVDAEPGLVWDSTGGPFNNRVYLVYTEEPINENNDTEIYLRTSTNDGATWSAPVRVNDDPLGPIRSQFLPYISLDPTSGTVAIGWHDARNDNGVPGSGGTNSTPNDDAEYYASSSTNGGVTWAPNTRLSGGFSNAAAAANGVDYGDYVGTGGAYGGRFVAVWADNANCDGTNANGTLHAFDLYMGSMTLPGLTTTPTATTTTATPTATATATITSTPTRTRTATPTSTPTSTPTNTRTNTPTGTPTNTSTNTPTGTPTDTPTPTETAAITLTPTDTPTAQTLLVGHVTWQGRPPQPDPLQQLPLTLTLRLASGGPDNEYPGLTTDAGGFFTVPLGSLPSGTYNWRVKGPNDAPNTNTTPGFLANSGSLSISSGSTTNAELGLMRAGDANNDNVVNAVDFSIVKNSFGKAGCPSPQPGYDPRADFSGDCVVNSTDFSLLRSNFGTGGAGPVRPQR